MPRPISGLRIVTFETVLLARRASGAAGRGRTSRLFPIFPLAPESTFFDEPIRQMLFGSGNRGTYRVLFTVIDKSVYVLHVRHGSMLPLASEEDEER